MTTLYCLLFASKRLYAIIKLLRSYSFPKTNDYMGLGYRRLNFYLRKREEGKNNELEAFKSELISELYCRKNYSNQIVWRWYSECLDHKEILAWFRCNIDNVVKHPEFLSASKWKKPGCTYYYRISTHRCSRGFQICKPSEVEQEVLFLPNTCFKVTSVDIENSIIDLEETIENRQDKILYDQFWIPNPTYYAGPEVNKHGI